LILNPATGLLIYNTTTSGFNHYDAGWKDYGTLQSGIQHYGLEILEPKLK
jgi:hypothetical protein